MRVHKCSVARESQVDVPTLPEFEWDEDKRQEVLRERGVDFLDAVLIFEGRVTTEKDERRDYAEDRYGSVGVADGQCYVVVHTPRGSALRIVTAWKAGRSQQSKHQAGLARRDSSDEGAG